MELLLELVLYLAGEFIFDVFAHLWISSANTHRTVATSILIYAFIGMCLGGMTLWLFPAHLIASRELRIVSLIVAPLVTAFVMAAIGAMRRNAGKRVVRMEEFLYAYTTALTVAVMRFFWAD